MFHVGKEHPRSQTSLLLIAPGTSRSQKPEIEVGKRKLLMTALNPETRTWPTTKGIFPKLSR